MRKDFFRGLFVLTVLAISISAPLSTSANNAVSVFVNGQKVSFEDQGPIIVDGRTLVPIRDVFEIMGFSVDWDESTSTVLLSDSDSILNIAIQIGAPYFSVAVFSPGAPVGHASISMLDVPAQIIEGRTMLPLRAVLESVGYRLEWDEETSTVLITSAADSETMTGVVNIRHLLRRNMDEVGDLLGYQTDFDPLGKWLTYYFNTGIQIGADGPEGARFIMSLWLDYRVVDNRFHFNGIHGDSTYDDVVALFGNEPYDASNYSYGFFLDSDTREFVHFYFSDDNRVVVIQFLGDVTKSL